jgi:hypothetical protein
MKAWCFLERVGKPALFVRNILVGTMMHLTGSPSHLAITSVDGKSSVTSNASECVSDFDFKSDFTDEYVWMMFG